MKVEMDQDQTELLARYTREQTEDREEKFLLVLSLPEASALIANLQLALRHPGNIGTTALVAERTCHTLMTEMEERGLKASLTVARLGFDPRYDLPSSRRTPGF